MVVLARDTAPAARTGQVVADLKSGGIIPVPESSLIALNRSVAADVELVIWVLPDDETEAIEVIRTIRACYSAPILAVSGALTIDSRVALLDGGATQVIEAPYHAAELLARARALKKRQDR